jgi:hypothetical protein
MEANDLSTERAAIINELSKTGFDLEVCEALDILSLKKLYQDSLQHYVFFHISNNALFDVDKFLSSACEQKREVLNFKKAIAFLHESITRAPISGHDHIVLKFSQLPAGLEGRMLKKNMSIFKEKLVEVAQCGVNLLQNFLELNFQSVRDFACTYSAQPSCLSSPFSPKCLSIATNLFLTPSMFNQKLAVGGDTSAISGRVSPAIRVTA